MTTRDSRNAPDLGFWSIKLTNHQILGISTIGGPYVGHMSAICRPYVGHMWATCTIQFWQVTRQGQNCRELIDLENAVTASRLDSYRAEAGTIGSRCPNFHKSQDIKPSDAAAKTCRQDAPPNILKRGDILNKPWTRTQAQLLGLHMVRR